MTFTNKEIQKVRQKTASAGSASISKTLDGTTTEEVINLGAPREKVSYMMTGTLVGTVEFSIDGKVFNNSAAIPAAGITATYTTNLATSVKVTRTSGSGTLSVASK